MTSKVYELIAGIEAGKKEKKMFPTHTLYNELLTASKLTRQELNKALNELFRLEVIQVGETVNDKYITINET